MAASEIKPDTKDVAVPHFLNCSGEEGVGAREAFLVQWFGQVYPFVVAFEKGSVMGGDEQTRFSQHSDFG